MPRPRAVREKRFTWNQKNSTTSTRPPESIRAWLFKTARRLIMDADKIARNRRRLRALNPTVDAPPELPDEALERKEARARVREVLCRMPERGREILLLRYSGFEYREIAIR